MRYRGDLAKPLEPLPVLGPLALATPKGVQNYFQRERQAEEFRRLGLLFEHYKLNEGDWMGLAIALTRDHVPGLRTMRGKPGAPKRWKPYQKALLRIQIEDLIRSAPRRSHGVTWAAGVLANRPVWKNFIGKRRNPREILRRAYYDADPELVNSIRHATASAKGVKKTP